MRIQTKIEKRDINKFKGDLNPVISSGLIVLDMVINTFPFFIFGFYFATTKRLIFLLFFFILLFFDIKIIVKNKDIKIKVIRGF